MKGPDFPTGGLIMGDDGIKEAYRTGRGTVRVRPVHEIEDWAARQRKRSCSPRSRSRRASTRSPASSPRWSRAGKIDGVRDIRNESGQGKTRLVIELRPDANPQIVLNNLFKHTPAQSTFGQHGRARRRRAAHDEPAGRDCRLDRPPGRSWSRGARSSGSTRRRPACTSSRAGEGAST